MQCELTKNKEWTIVFLLTNINKGKKKYNNIILIVHVNLCIN